ncbi:hypothetical protein [uncultured Thiodictyon sp.]|uniref:hypothetical protein n=1 Tax=uncultured Thiodictyon sp. TaxID=1846217 RepID=UPI0025E5AE15|nr:hypothetical protein [uncultured Thiodictyon sp.]
MNNSATRILLVCCALLLPALAFSQTPREAAPRRAPSAGPATETVESLRQQLAAQRAISEQLRARVKVLEHQLASGTAGGELLVVGLHPDAAKPPVESASPNSAIAEALVTKGLVLLPSGTLRLTPSVTWFHDGQGDNHYESFAYGLGLEAGLPWGLAASLYLPYVQRNYPLGRKDGTGDLSIGLGKQLTQETAAWPSLVARLTYTHDNGADPFGPVPIGDGFRSITASVSALKRSEPVALYGTVSYRHAWPKTATFWGGLDYQTGRLTPADSYGLTLGVSLAATPGISLDTGLSFDFTGRTRVEPLGGEAYQSAIATAGYFTLGADFTLGKNLFLNLSAAAGVTADANDFIFSIMLPYRF